MTVSDYHTFVSEFRHKIAPSVRKHIQDGNIDLTNKMKTQLREIMALDKDAEVPVSALRYLPKAIEPQENPSETEVFALITMSLPKMVGGELKFDRVNSTDAKIIAKICPDKVLLISGGALTEFKKSKAPYSRRKAAAVTKPKEAQLDSLLPTFVRSKTVPKFPAKISEAPAENAEQSTGTNKENAE